MFGHSDWWDMDDDEELLWASHPSMWIVYPQVAIGLLIVLTSLILAIRFPLSTSIGPVPTSVAIVFLGLVAGSFPPSIAYLKRKTTVYAITSRQIWYKSGIIKREDVDPILIEHIVDRGYKQSYFDVFVGKGDFRFLTRGGTDDVDVVFEDVPDPSAVRAHLEEAEKRQGVETDTDSDADDATPTDPTATLNSQLR